jgi:hypothetical protein
VVAIGLKIKHRLLVAEGGGFDFIAELSGHGTGDLLPLLDRIALFREDILLPGIAGSILYLGLLRLLRPSLRPLAAGVVCLALYLLLYIELKAYWEVGTFISASMIGNGLLGAGQGLIAEYLESATLRRLVGSLTVLVAVSSSLEVMRRSGRLVGFLRRFSGANVLLTAAAAAGVIAGLALRPRATPYDVSAFRGALLAFVGASNALGWRPLELDDVSPDSAIALYARTANAPVPNAPSPMFGRARGYDVVIFLYESLPSACASLPAADTSLPNLRALARRGFRADAHYATYPYSRRAYLSIYASWYPENTIRGAFEELGRITRDLSAPGVVRAAANAGYETAAFVPEEPVSREEDVLRYAALGFARHHVPASAYLHPAAAADSGESRRAWHRVRDAESFDSLQASVERAVAANRRYLYAYHPQLTHGPWPGLDLGSSREATCAAGLALYREVDTHLGELMRLLERLGRLDRTIIVALGDHGLRTRREYPPFRPGTLDDVTFHVPLSFWAPGVVDSTVAIPWMTSHIDIAPSILDLLGIGAGRGLEMGSPMWDARLRSRATYFLAREYLGADGYQREAEAVMLRYLYGGVSRAEWRGQLRFRVSDLLQRVDTVAHRVARDLRMVSAVQQRLTRTMLPEEADDLGRAIPSAAPLVRR